MRDFGFNLDAELELMRGKEKKKEKTGEKTEAESKKEEVKKQVERKEPESKPELKREKPREDKGLEIKQSQEERIGGGSSDNEFKDFKTLPGIFEYVGGVRPVELNQNIKRSQVSGMLEPMFPFIQKHLQRHIGAVVSFPWGEYKIKADNKVFTTKSTLVRYLMFDALRDEELSHIQYAKQWLVLQHPVYDKTFNPEINMNPNSDELDIYCLLVVSTGEKAPSKKRNVGDERLEMINIGISRVFEKVLQQERALNSYIEKESVRQTILLLDRMGLLKGGIPKDIGAFVRILEQNRDLLTSADGIIEDHVEGEKERRKTLLRQERLNKFQREGR